jgi:hypothetical protein
MYKIPANIQNTYNSFFILRYHEQNNTTKYPAVVQAMLVVQELKRPPFCYCACHWLDAPWPLLAALLSLLPLPPF